ncbi:uncharacterized protein FIBRA_06487 [Fibroporia radiculosa]|uniref:very-long-chain enoyl-CoA reductase n=1 Tax=Fibroporia radiculosa TaxID=599839 RepID=J4IBA4_9APHY|nr:uncharacterized protein FIBRA_06487 [Fibroporia radiculosa]CCM04316.1 predicted protein [Fibroporia radiculosa]
MVTVNVSAVGRVSLARGLPVTITLDKNLEDVTVADVKAAVATKFPRFYASRQKLTLKGERKALADEITLKDTGLSDGGELTVKDLGAQLGWRTVYVIEYAGPLIIHPLIYNYPRFWYGALVPKSMLQKMVFGLVLAHFIKRELETIYVHRFSHGTMPFSFVFRNSAHYWVLSGFLLAAAVYSPTYDNYAQYVRGSLRDNPRFLWSCAALWLFAELSNLYAHLTLRSLRPEGTKTRSIPYGYGFALVSCPHYFFEIISWVAIAAMTGSYAAWFFVAVSTYILAMWALKRHKAYRKEFKEYPRERKAIFPFIL